MRFVLVIDLADDWAEDYKDFTVDYDLRGTPIDDEKVNESIKYVEDVKLRPLPQKKEIDKTLVFGGYENVMQEALARGYNAYYNEIIGETE